MIQMDRTLRVKMTESWLSIQTGLPLMWINEKFSQNKSNYTQRSAPSLHPGSLWLRNHSASLCYVGVVPGLCTHRLEEGQKGIRFVTLLLAAQLKETTKVAYKIKGELSS